MLLGLVASCEEQQTPYGDGKQERQGQKQVEASASRGCCGTTGETRGFFPLGFAQVQNDKQKQIPFPPIQLFLASLHPKNYVIVT
jgi:hypothetical protein